MPLKNDLEEEDIASHARCGTPSAPKSEYKTTPREKKGGAKKNQRRIHTTRSIRGRDDDERERKREKQKR
jgi:hypothetical protein